MTELIIGWCTTLTTTDCSNKFKNVVRNVHQLSYRYETGNFHTEA